MHANTECTEKLCLNNEARERLETAPLQPPDESRELDDGGRAWMAEEEDREDDGRRS